MNSPTSTMPTPSAQTWPGPSTRSRLIFCRAAPLSAAATDATAGRWSAMRVVSQQFVVPFLRGQQDVLGELAADAQGVGHHPRQERAGQQPRAVLEDVPDIHSLLLRATVAEFFAN